MTYPILQRINPPFEITTPLGEAVAHWIFIQNTENVEWGVCVKTTGESWWFENQYIRYSTNLTNGRVKTTPIKEMPGMAGHLARTEAKDGPG